MASELISIPTDLPDGKSLTEVKMELGRVVPDLGFITSPGRVVALSRLCPARPC